MYFSITPPLHPSWLVFRMKVCVIASGSTGNSVYVEEGATKVLIDAGLSGKQIEERLMSIGVNVRSLTAIVVSHEHSDHVGGVGGLGRRFGIPIWITEPTMRVCRKVLRGAERIRMFDNDQAFFIGDLHFQPFALSHDAIDPVNFTVTGGDSCLGIATDMGIITQLVFERLRSADLVVMETNYDRDLLMNGPSPWSVKQRISGNRGHLANDTAAEALSGLASHGLQQAVLAHLSDQSNQPKLAEAACRDGLGRAGVRDFLLSVAVQDRPSQIFVI